MQGVAEPVALQVDGLRRRLGVPLADELVRAVAIGAVAVLVDVVAHVQHEVQVVAHGDAAVGPEITAGVVAARHEGEAQRMGGRGVVGRGTGAADVAGLTGGGEAVPVLRIGRQAVDVDLHGVIRRGVGPGPARPHHAAEVGVQRDLPHDGERRAESAARGGHGRPGRGGAGPDDDGVGEGVTAGHAVAEDPLVGGSGRGRDIEGAERDGGGRRDDRSPLQDGAAGGR